MKMFFRLLRNTFVRIVNKSSLIAFSVLHSMWTLFLVLHCINAELPNPEITRKALSVMIIIALALDIIAIGIKCIDACKAWKAEGYTFSLKLDDELDGEE